MGHYVCEICGAGGEDDQNHTFNERRSLRVHRAHAHTNRVRMVNGSEPDKGHVTRKNTFYQHERS